MKAPTPAPRSVSTDRLEFRGATITSDAGLLACRELDDALGLTETADECLQESRGGRNVQHRLRQWCTVVWRATRIPTTLNGWPRTRRCGSSLDGETLTVRRQHQHHEPVRDRGAHPRRQRGGVGPTER